MKGGVCVREEKVTVRWHQATVSQGPRGSSAASPWGPWPGPSPSQQPVRNAESQALPQTAQSEAAF